MYIKVSVSCIDQLYDIHFTDSCMAQYTYHLHDTEYYVYFWDPLGHLSITAEVIFLIGNDRNGVLRFDIYIISKSFHYQELH